MPCGFFLPFVVGFSGFLEGTGRPFRLPSIPRACLPGAYPMPKLTKRSIDAARPAARGDVFLWDGQLPGFGLRIKPSGAKSLILQYRNRNGRSRRLTIGR